MRDYQILGFPDILRDNNLKVRNELISKLVKLLISEKNKARFSPGRHGFFKFKEITGYHNYGLFQLATYKYIETNVSLLSKDGFYAPIECYIAEKKDLIFPSIVTKDKSIAKDFIKNLLLKKNFLQVFMIGTAG